MSKEIEDAIARGQQRRQQQATDRGREEKARAHAEEKAASLAEVVETATADDKPYAEVAFPGSDEYDCRVAADLFAQTAREKGLSTRIVSDRQEEPDKACKVRLYYRTFKAGVRGQVMNHEDQPQAAPPPKQLGGWTKVTEKQYTGVVNGRTFRADIKDTGTNFWTAESVFVYMVREDGTDEFVTICDYEHMMAGQEEGALVTAWDKATKYVPGTNKK